MSLYLYIAETSDSIRAKVAGYASVAGLKLSNWIAGGVGFQILETFTTSLAGLSGIQAKAIRGFASLDTSVDPGDDDPYDASNAGLAPKPGALSDLGSNFYGTDRGDETFAIGAITFINTGSGATLQKWNALELTFQSTVAGVDGTFPTYRNGAAINAGVGTSPIVPVIAEAPGTAYNADPGVVTILVNTLPGVTVTNVNAILGSDRQSADDYRNACRDAQALTSPNGPGDSYRYLAVTGRDDGTWGNSTTGNSLGINRVQVLPSSTTGIARVYFATPSGGAGLANTVTATTGPFVGKTFLQAVNLLITSTPGVISVPGCITYIGTAATDTTIPVTYTAKAKASSVNAVPGVYTKVGGAASSPDASADAIFAAADAALELYLETVDVGGLDQVSGAGFIYTSDLGDTIKDSWSTMYAVALTAPAGASTAIAVGHDGVLGTVTRQVTLT